MNHLNLEELSYLAGFIDGEGSLSIQKRLHSNIQKGKEYTWEGYSIYMDIANTNKEIIDYIHKIIGEGFVRKNKKYPGRKIAYGYRFCGLQCQKFIKVLFPKLIVKKRIAEIFIQFPFSAKDNELKEKLFLEAKEINRRGD